MIFESSPKIKINKERGIYGFSDDGSTGKSYLYSLLHDLEKSGYGNILSITYYTENIVQKIKNLKEGVIFLDRLDLYLSEDLQRELEKKRDSCLVLFDLKDWNRLVIQENGIGKLNLSVNSIEVVLYEVGF